MKSFLKGLLVVMSAVMLSGCGMMFDNDDDSDSEQQEPTSTDSDLSESNGQEDSAEHAESSFDNNELRIVSLMPSNTEILDALGFTEDIIGISSEDTYPESLVEDESVAQIDSFEFDAEQILELEPTHIFSHENNREMHEDVLREISAATDAEVFYIEDATSIEGIYETISEMGSHLDVEEKAEEVNEVLRDDINQVVDKYEARTQSPEVFIQVAPYPDVFTSGSNTFIDDAIQEIGADNAFSDLEGFTEVSIEEILERDPEYIVSIIDDYDEAALQEDVQSFSETDQLNISDADNQCVIDPDLLSRPGPRIDEGLEHLGNCIFE